MNAHQVFLYDSRSPVSLTHYRLRCTPEAEEHFGLDRSLRRFEKGYSPRNPRNASSTACIVAVSTCPIGVPSLVRGTAVALSTMIWECERRPVDAPASRATRKSGAS